MAVAGLPGGALTAGTYAVKFGSRALINTSPKPFPNLVASFDEDALFVDVYSSSDTMNEVLVDKYPDVRSLARDVAVLKRFPGAVALAAEIDRKSAAYAIVRPRKQMRKHMRAPGQ
jgi:hypothetical protein